MKICNIVPFFAPHFGGVVDRCYHITKELAGRGHKVTLCTSDYQYDSNYANTLHNINIKVFRSFFGRFCIIPGLKSFLLENASQYDAFHLMNNYSYVNIIAGQICYEKKIPFMYSAMGSLPIMSRSFFRKYIFNKSIGKKIVHRASALCAITDQESAQYIAYDSNVSPSKIYKIPNAIEDTFDPTLSGAIFRKRFNISMENKIILFVGRLEFIKGADLLIKAFKKIHSIHTKTVLAFVGPDFGEKEKIVSLVNKFGLSDRVLITGPLFERDKLCAYAAAHLLVVPSRRENMSIVALEGAAWKLPVVITQTSGFPEIEIENAGYVVTPTVEGIAEGINKVLMKSDHYNAMRENARNMVIRNYLWASVGKKIENVFLSIV